MTRLRRVRHVIAMIDWDDLNLEKIDAHGISPEEVEEVFVFRPLLARHLRHPDRFVAIGPAEEGERLLFVPYEYEARRRAARPVTADEAEHARWYVLYDKAMR